MSDGLVIVAAVVASVLVVLGLSRARTAGVLKRARLARETLDDGAAKLESDAADQPAKDARSDAEDALSAREAADAAGVAARETSSQDRPLVGGSRPRSQFAVDLGVGEVDP